MKQIHPRSVKLEVLMTENFEIDKSFVRYMKTNRSVLCEATHCSLLHTLLSNIKNPLFIEESVLGTFIAYWVY